MRDGVVAPAEAIVGQLPWEPIYLAQAAVQRGAWDVFGVAAIAPVNPTKPVSANAITRVTITFFMTFSFR